MSTDQLFSQIPIFCDDQSWVKKFFEQSLKFYRTPMIILPTHTSVRRSWERFKTAHRFLIHWQGHYRNGGAIVEEILDINSQFDVANKVIVFLTHPLREDILYLSELGVKRIIQLRQRDADLKRGLAELGQHLTEEFSRNPLDLAWHKVLQALDFMHHPPQAERLAKIERAIANLQKKEKKTISARALDALASLCFYRQDHRQAELNWLKAIDVNPQYFRAYNNLFSFYYQSKRYDDALKILHRAHGINRQRIKRLVQFGDIHRELNDNHKSEHYYRQALKADQYCSAALTGLAAIKFEKGDLESAKTLLSKSSVAYRYAAELNYQGIQLVKQGAYEQALEHYTKAQYVIPNEYKGPKLFYNIGLCYIKWGKPDMAEQFLKLALIKEPDFKKAQNLLQKVKRTRYSQPHAS